MPTPKKTISNADNITKNLQVFKVGGCVRDELLGLISSDNDYVVIGGSIQQMLDLGFKQVGRDFPVFLHPKTHEEYAMARSEKKIGVGYRGFSYEISPNITLEEDLARRDITINAIAKDISGKLIDPFNGISDLKKKLIRHIAPAFIDDPLRILRVARFAAKLDFTIVDETLNLMRKMSQNGELQTLSKERIWQEFTKSIMTKNILTFFIVLDKVYALEIVFPEFVALLRNHTQLKILQNILLTLHNTNSSLEERFAILYYYVSTVYSITDTDKFIVNSYVNLKCKKLATMLDYGYLHMSKLETLNIDEIYTLVQYLDPIRNKERYKSYIKLASMIANANNDNKIVQNIETINQIIEHFNKIDYAKLQKEYPKNIVEQLRKLKYQVIKQICYL